MLLSCPGCFSHLAYNAVRHEVYKHQFRAFKLSNCYVDQTKII